jgi:predicted DNA-binding transcriptional regulator AlpA
MLTFLKPDHRENALPTNFDSDRLVSEREAAALMGVSRDTLRRLRANGEGPPVIRVSQRRIGIKLRAIRDYLASR